MPGYQKIDPAQIDPTVQVMLDYLSDPQNLTPNNMVEAMASGKSVLRGILSGQLVVCKVVEEPNPTAAPPENE